MNVNSFFIGCNIVINQTQVSYVGMENSLTNAQKPKFKSICSPNLLQAHIKINLKTIS